jgi:hypothetical protein
MLHPILGIDNVYDIAYNIGGRAHYSVLVFDFTLILLGRK